MTIELNKLQLQILQHSLGCDQYGRGCSSRNHFVTDESSNDGRTCLELVSLGLMTNDGPRALCGGMSVFHVTAEGKDVMRSQSPEPPPEPKLTRSQKRYLEYIRSDSGLSYREWLGIKPKQRTKQR